MSIFISYRREDSQETVGRLYDHLIEVFPRETVFKDVDSIPLGTDFRKHLSDAVGKCAVVLAFVGPRWCDITDNATHSRRLDDPTDFVRIELEAALARGIPVIPVLVSNAAMPREAQVPESLSPFTRRQGISVRPDPDFHRDKDRLIQSLREMLTTPLASGSAAAPRRVLPWTSIAPRPAPPDPAIPSDPPPPVAPPAPGDEAAVRRALEQLAVTHAGTTIPNLVGVAKDLHRITNGRELLVLDDEVRKPGASSLHLYKAISLMGAVLRLPGARAYVEKAFDTIVDYGLLSPSLDAVSLEALKAAPVSPRRKWTALAESLSMAKDSLAPPLVDAIAHLTPQDQRQATGALLTDILVTTQAASTIHQVCRALQGIGYRDATPTVIDLLTHAAPTNAVYMADLMVAWRVIDAVPAIRDCIDRSRYGSDSAAAFLLASLYALEGPAATPYLCDVLREANPQLQVHILNRMGGVSDSMAIELVAELHARSTDVTVKNYAATYLKNKGYAV